MKTNNAKANRDWMNRYYESRRAVYVAYGGKCACCGETYHPFLTIDHVTPVSSTKEKRKIGRYLYDHLVKNGFPAEYQLLCWNCNKSKGVGTACWHAKDIDTLQMSGC